MALGLSVSLSLVNAFDLSNVGKALEKAQDAGIVTTGIPTKKQFEEKIKTNAKANANECKKFYHQEQIDYRGVLDGMLEKETLEKYKDMLGEWDKQGKKALPKFDIKPFVKEYKKDTKKFKPKDKLHEFCKTVLTYGLTDAEKDAFQEETYEKYNSITGTEIPRNKNKK